MNITLTHRHKRTGKLCTLIAEHGERDGKVYGMFWDHAYPGTWVYLNELEAL